MSISEVQHLTVFYVLLQSCRGAARIQREQGACFEELILACPHHGTVCGDLYSQVQPSVTLSAKQHLECSRDAQMEAYDGRF